MRHGRAKAARKTLQYFKRVTGLTAPYRVLLDATIVAAFFQHHVLPVKERVDKVLQTFGNPNLQNSYCITKSAVEELVAIHQELQSKHHPKASAFEQALEWIQKECRVLEISRPETEEPSSSQEKDSEEDAVAQHSKKRKRHATRVAPLTPAQQDFIHCIEEDERPFVVGSQDDVILDKLRNMGSVPIIRLANQSVLLLEQPSKQSQLQSRGDERRKWKHSLAGGERALVDLVKQEEKKHKAENTTVPTQRVKAKAKGPNPLSCKRKQQAGGGAKESASTKRRRRAKKRKED